MHLEGRVHPAFARTGRVAARILGGSGGGGGAVCVYHRGRPVIDVWGGEADPATGRPWESDTMAISWSTTKGVAALALHMCVDRGLVGYDDPVSRVWPGFARAGKERLRIRDLLCHRAGLHRIHGRVSDARELMDWDRAVAVLEGAAPEPVGDRPGYHALTFGWLIGEVVRRLDGRSVGTFVAEEVAGPLGLDGCFIGTPPSQRHRVAPLVPQPDPERAERVARVLSRWRATRRTIEALWTEGLMELFAGDPPPVLDTEMPAANGTFTARSLARIYGALAGGGTLDGVTLVSARRILEMGEVQTTARDYVLGLRMHWRLGYHRAFVLALRQPRTAFGHFGYGGSGAWCDPSRDLAVAFVTNRIGGGTTPVGDLRLVRLGRAALRDADAASGP